MFALSLGLVAQQASAATMKELFELTFNTPTESASGPMEGDLADMVRRTVPIQGDIMTEVKTIKHFKQKDCRRFLITMKAMYAPTSGTSGAVPLPALQMNYCKGGSFPLEGYDANAGKRVNEQIGDYARTQGIQVPEASPAAAKIK